MYKVFVDNKPVTFKANSEAELMQNFSNHKFIQAAGGLVRLKDTYLFIKRNGVWDIPKGKLDKGETPEAGAVREIVEECGIPKPVIVKHITNTWHTYEHKGKHVLKKTWWYLLKLELLNTDPVPQTDEGITEVKFFKKEDFQRIKNETFESIKLVIELMEQE
ncbi:MAG: NUDIX domain-containing protein [Crocinitomicaceae bacterium]|nr:NUDIX domain-containing protein [Crocinitomicaceae bacterium]